MITPNYHYNPSTIPPSIRTNAEIKAEIARIDLFQSHDLIYYGGHRRVDLAVFVGNDQKPPLPKFLKDFKDADLEDLVERTDGKLPLEELKQLRTLLRMLEVNTQFRRIEHLCAVCSQY